MRLHRLASGSHRPRRPPGAGSGSATRRMSDARQPAAAGVASRDRLGDRCSRRRERPRRRLRGCPSAGRSTPSSRATSIATAATSSPSSDPQRSTAEHRPRQAPASCSRPRCGPPAEDARRGGRTTSTSRSASRRWAKRHRAPHDPLRVQRPNVASASRRSAIVCGPGVRSASEQSFLVAPGYMGLELAHEALDLDVLGHLAQRRLAQRGQVLEGS